ncbi:MAG: NADH-quinone oxidoreductase subunit J [Acidilobaceae archaeon]
MSLLLVAVIAAIALGVAAVALRDLVYSSLSLAVLGIATASLLALSGYLLPAILVILVYVGSAVMLLVVSVSMIGGVESEPKSSARGAIAGVAAFSLALLLYVESRGYIAEKALEHPYVSIEAVASTLVEEYPLALALIVLSLLATAIEGLLLLRVWGARR